MKWFIPLANSHYPRLQTRITDLRYKARLFPLDFSSFLYPIYNLKIANKRPFDGTRDNRFPKLILNINFRTWTLQKWLLIIVESVSVFKTWEVKTQIIERERPLLFLPFLRIIQKFKRKRFIYCHFCSKLQTTKMIKMLSGQRLVKFPFAWNSSKHKTSLGFTRPFPRTPLESL